MPTVVQFRRGTTTQNNNFLGANGEISVDTTLHVLRVADGETEGGFALVGETAAQTITNKVYQGTSLSVTGNVTGGNIITSGTHSSTGNITGANLLTGGIVSAAGNITGNYILGNGSQLTGIDATSIQNGTSNVRVVSSGGNVSVGIGGTPNVAIFTSSGIDVTGYVSASGNIIGGNVLSDGLISTTATLSGNALSITNQVNTATLFATGTATIQGNVSIGVSGKNPALNIFSTGDISPTTNAIANIGNATNTFNTIFAKATSAQYADLAEMYCADTTYTPGTVVEFGGEQEITVTTKSHSTTVAGIISTNPSYLMNSTLNCDNALQVALVGRVPCQVVGTIRKGDRLVASHLPGVATALDKDLYEPGCIVAKSLEDYDSNNVGTIEVAVGRL